MILVKAAKWTGLFIAMVLAIIIGAMMAEAAVEVLHIFGIGSGTCGSGSSGYILGAIVGYVIAKNGWM